jgi:fused signal recognition particle receptor
MKLFENVNIKKLKSGLTNTRNKIVNSIQETITRKAVIDDTTIDDIEEILITSDIGFDTAERIIEKVRTSLVSDKDRSEINIINTVKDELVSVIINGTSDNKQAEDELKNTKPFVILIIGVNGVGKTTTIGKLAHNFVEGGAKVIVAVWIYFRKNLVQIHLQWLLIQL